MPTHAPGVVPLTGRQRYLLIDALDKRIATLAYRELQRFQCGEPVREDLALLKEELKDLRAHVQLSARERT